MERILVIFLLATSVTQSKSQEERVGKIKIEEPLDLVSPPLPVPAVFKLIEKKEAELSDIEPDLLELSPDPEPELSKPGLLKPLPEPEPELSKPDLPKPIPEPEPELSKPDLLELSPEPEPEFSKPDLLKPLPEPVPELSIPVYSYGAIHPIARPYPSRPYPSPPKQFLQDEGLSGEGSLEIYNNFNWTVEAGTAEEDLQLLENWNNTQSRILDLVLIMDCTGSMSAWIEHSKTTLKTVIDDIVSGNEDVRVRVAFVGFRDFVDDDIFVIKDFTFDINEVKSFISQRHATGGGDLPEDVVGALHQTLQLSWYPGSVRLATVIADAPTHGHQYHSKSNPPRDDYPEGSPAGLVLEEVVKELRRKEVALTLYKLEDSTEAMYDVIEETINDENWVDFVDIRKEIQENSDKGLSLSSGYLASAYSVKSGAKLKHQFQLQSALKGWY